MTFARYIKSKIEIKTISECYLETDGIFAQYNYDRFKKWKSLYKESERDVLNMRLSPHYEFLKVYEKTNGIMDFSKYRYYKMHILYGKNRKWINNKIKNFISLYRHVKEGNCVDLPIILTSPISKNPYNSSYEIYEGHHRVAIYLFLGRDKIRVNLSEWRIKIESGV